jgi:protease-4
MKRSSARLLLILFLLFFLVVIPLLALVGLFSTRMPALEGSVALVADVRGEFPDYTPYFAPSSFFGKREPNMADLLECLRRAGSDGSVETVVLRIYPSGAGVAKCEEISEALLRLREAGKMVIAYSPVLVGHHYLMACAADSLFMPPSGYLVVPGASSRAVFIRGTLDKLGIRPNIHRIGEYKSYAESLTERERSPQSREMAQWLLQDIYGRFVFGVADRRGVEPGTVEGWIERGLYNPERALDERLIDDVRYWDRITASLEDEGMRIVEMCDYLASSANVYAEALEPKIAVVHVQGEIVMGDSGFDMSSGGTAGSETVIRALRKARDNNSVKAVVLRVDSPGGDAFAGDMISREVELTSAVKPVVVSMSDVAASGGYEVAYRADRIVALPGSITGSIGSITGKLNMRGFYNKIGITKDEMGIGDKALIFSDYRDYSEEEWRVIEEEHWAFYRNWVEDIALHRDMRFGEVDSIARGRVWTGDQALSRGLVDETGGLQRAVEIACEKAGAGDPSRIVLLHLPRPMTFLQSLLSGQFVRGLVSFGAYTMLQDLLGEEDRASIRHELDEGFVPGGLD